MDIILKNIEVVRVIKTEYPVGKNQGCLGEEKKTSWGGIVESSLQTISDSKSVLKIFVFIF